MNKILKYITAFSLLLFGPGVFFVCASTINASPSSVPVLNGLVAWWTFDNKNTDWVGNTTADVSGHGNVGSMVSMSLPGSSTIGKVGDAFVFDGLSSYVSLGSNPISSLASPSSACTWAYSSNISLASGGSNQTFLTLFTDTGNRLRMGSIVSTGIFFVSYEAGGSFYGAQSTSQVFTNNAWNHVCYVWDGSTVTLYVNGAAVPTGSNTDPIGSENLIGARDSSGDGNWAGGLDDMHVYNRAITSLEVSQLYLSTNPSNVLQQGLIGYWTFDGKDTPWTSATAGTANDLSGNGLTGTLDGMTRAASPVPGKIGQALGFDGASSYVNVGSISSPVQSVSFWVKASNTTEKIIDLNGTAGIEVSGGTVIPDNFTSPTVYVDGAISSTITANAWHHVVVTTNAPITASAVTIGRIGSGYFGGSLDDVRVYNRALPAVQVTQLYDLGSETAGKSFSQGNLKTSLAAWWTFDGKDTPWTSAFAGTANDLSGNGNTGTLANMGKATSTGIGKIGQALGFDGAASYVNAGTMGTLGSNIANGLTISVWVKPGSTSIGYVMGSLANSARNGFYMQLNAAHDGSTNTVGSVNIGLDDNTAIVSHRVIGATDAANVPQNVWTNIVATIMPSTNTIIIYVNGASQPVTYGVQNTPTVFANYSQFLALGALNNNGSVGSFYSGLIDDVRIYNRVLSATEVAQLRHVGRETVAKSISSGNFQTGLLGWWTFDGKDTPWTSATAGTANDLSGNGLTGTLDGMTRAASPVPGKIGQALGFDGASSYVNVGSISSPVQSVSFWVKASNTTEKIIDLNGTAGIEVSGGTVIPDNFTSPTVYVDGAISSTITANAWHHVVVTTNAPITASAVTIGRIGSGYFGGSLDDVRVYGRVLSVNEVDQIYDAGK